MSPWKRSFGGASASSEFLAIVALQDRGHRRSSTLNDINEEDDDTAPPNFWQRRARQMARRPWLHFWVAMVTTIVISFCAFAFGEFSTESDNAGWQSRGTLIADRQTQALLVLLNDEAMFSQGDIVWDDLIQNIQPRWEADTNDETRRQRSRNLAGGLENESDTGLVMTNGLDVLGGIREKLVGGIEFAGLAGATQVKSGDDAVERKLPFVPTDELGRRLQGALDTITEQGCDATWYTSEALTEDTALWPVWKTTSDSISVLDAGVVEGICNAEQNTIRVLEDNGLCRDCNGGNAQCMPAYSLVLFARLIVGDTSLSLSCAELASAWQSNKDETTGTLQQCTGDVIDQGHFDTIPSTCPLLFTPALVDEFFGPSEPLSRYTSSIFRTKNDGKGMYDVATEFDQGSSTSLVEGAYDTQDEDFINRYVEGVVNQDMSLALGSAIITTLAIILHTKSCWLTTIGLMQIILSFPLAFFVYHFVGRIEFFPFLNFLGVFVVFALGADDVFVAVDKWKNARLANPDATVEDIAASALPDAAGAMFLTTLTTAVAFFATAISPVAPLKCFAIFLGLLIVFDYILCCALIFPALCLYDKWKGNGCCCLRVCVTCGGRGYDRGAEIDDNDNDGPMEVKKTVDDGNVEGHGEEEQGVLERTTDDADGTPEPTPNHAWIGGRTSLIHYVLLSFYKLLHFARWPLLALSVAGFVVSLIVALQMELPSTTTVRVVNENKIQYEQAYAWRRSLLQDALDRAAGSEAIVIWGVLAADTGTKTNPDSWTQLVLDDSFDPSVPAAQSYLASFCDDFFAQEFAAPDSTNYVCPINEFNTWLQNESNSTNPSADYQNNCNGATGLPMDQGSFHSCFVSWSLLTNTISVLSRNGIVEIMYIRFISRARLDSTFDELSTEWNLLEDYLSNERDNVAPNECNGMYHSSFDFWWFDTNGSMLRAAFSAAGIALGAAGFVVLFASKSFILTGFAVFTICFVLASATAMLVGIGWTLGFLESICFAILIGISCDFVIHFGHAFAMLEGNYDKHIRTKFALLTMGPSILAAAFTTICSAVVMLFTVISFFRKFAVILCFTVLQATIGSFIIYLTLAETLGPARPTYTIDWILAKIQRKEFNDKSKPEIDEDVDEEGDETKAAAKL